MTYLNNLKQGLKYKLNQLSLAMFFFITDFIWIIKLDGTCENDLKVPYSLS